MTGSAASLPDFEALRGPFQVREELRVREALPNLREDILHEFPDAEKFAAGFKKEVFVEKAVIQQRSGLLPVAEHHAGEGAGFGSGRRQAHGIVETLHVVIPEEPIARLAQPVLTPQVINLQVKLRLFVRQFCFHGCLPPLFLDCF